MKLKSKDSTKGKIRQVKVNIHDDIWKIEPCNIEAEGNSENIDGNIQEELGQVEMHVSSSHETAMVVRPEAGPLMLIDMK